MRDIFSTTISSLFGQALSSAHLSILPHVDAGAPPRGQPKRRNKTGHRYPFSSTRQNARYARQLAAGQLAMAGVNNEGV